MRYVILAMALVAAGCVTHTYPSVVLYTIAPELDVPQAEGSDRTLGLRPLIAALPYRQQVMFRASDFELRPYDNVQWAELPRDMVTRALTDALVASKRFEDVGNAADLNAPDWILTGELRRFDEVHTCDPWVAECEVRLELRDALGSAAIWAATLSAREPLAQNDVAALAPAMSRAVAIVVHQAAEQIAVR